MPNFETLIDMLYQMTRSDHLVADHSVDLILQRRMPAHTTENATMGMAMLVAAHALMESNPKQFQHYNFTTPARNTLASIRKIGPAPSSQSGSLHPKLLTRHQVQRTRRAG